MRVSSMVAKSLFILKTQGSAVQIEAALVQRELEYNRAIHYNPNRVHCCIRGFQRTKNEAIAVEGAKGQSKP